MVRFNQNILVNDFKYNVQKQDKASVELQNKVSSRQKYLHPHENPNEVRLGMMFRSSVSEYGRYESNIEQADGKYNFIDAKLTEVNSYLHRINELVVKGSNGTYNQDDRKIMANEIDEYLRQIVQVANSTYYDGETVFSGDAVNVSPFEISEARVEGAGKPLVSEVEYKGDLGKQYVEISRGEYVETAFNGNEVFWAKNVRIQSNTEADSFISDKEQKVRINGIEIQINEGDNLETVVDKINATNVAVKAEIVVKDGKKFVAMEGTTPHQPWLEDIDGGNVLQSLGVIAQGGSNPPGNYSPSAKVYSESIFDKVIRARDALYNDGAYHVGNTLDGVIKDSISHIAEYQAIVGTKHARINHVAEHVSKVKLQAQELEMKFAGLDVTETAKAFSELKNLEAMRNATLQMGARMIPPSLLDFLR